MAELYTCEICKRTDLATEEDEIWYNIKNKHFNTLLTLCWNCALKRCCYCSEDGTWYQKYEMCLCDSCYNQKIKKKCMALGCKLFSTANYVCKGCGEHFCEKHFKNDGCCSHCSNSEP